MCTLLTVNKAFFDAHKFDVIRQIRTDAIGNGDGWSLICMDPDDPSINVHLQAMCVSTILRNLNEFMAIAESPSARMWLHARAATGINIGIGYCHGFTDLRGQFIMHNGIIRADTRVDSFALSFDYSFVAEKMLCQLLERHETFANIFLINEDEYSVIRVMSGRLYSDCLGNFSTNPFADIIEEVPECYVETFAHAEPTSATWMNDDDEDELLDEAYGLTESERLAWKYGPIGKLTDEQWNAIAAKKAI